MNDKLMLKIFDLVNYKLSVEELQRYLHKEEHKDYLIMPDYLLCIFLDGFIQFKRGKKEGEEELTQAERVASSKKQKLNNNVIVNKIKIALSLKAEDLIEILKLADFRISKSEISAFFRKPSHRNYRECGNQFLRNMLTGITSKYQTKQKAFKKVEKPAKNDKPVEKSKTDYKNKPGYKGKSNTATK